MNLPVASWALVRYNIDGEALWHERHILLKCSSLTTMMAVETPDGDVYLEDLRRRGGGGAIREVEFTDHRGEVVPGCDQCYRFRHDPTPVSDAICFGKACALVQQFDGKDPEIERVLRCSGDNRWECVHGGSTYSVGTVLGQQMPDGSAHLRPVSFAIAPDGSLFKAMAAGEAKSSAWQQFSYKRRKLHKACNAICIATHLLGGNVDDLVGDEA